MRVDVGRSNIFVRDDCLEKEQEVVGWCGRCCRLSLLSLSVCRERQAAVLFGLRRSYVCRNDLQVASRWQCESLTTPPHPRPLPPPRSLPPRCLQPIPTHGHLRSDKAPVSLRIATGGRTRKIRTPGMPTPLLETPVVFGPPPPLPLRHGTTPPQVGRGRSRKNITTAWTPKAISTTYGL